MSLCRNVFNPSVRPGVISVTDTTCYRILLRWVRHLHLKPIYLNSLPHLIFIIDKMNMIWYDCPLLEDFWSSAASLTPVVPAECALQCTSFVFLRICLCVKLSLWERLKVQFLWEMHFSISKYKCSRRIIDSLKPRSDQQGFNRPLHAYRLQFPWAWAATPGGNWF